MRALLIYPRFPRTFWSFEGVLTLVGRKALMPPLGLATVAALLPPTWALRLVDRNVRDLLDADWDWAELVLLSAMNVQRADFLALIAQARARGKPVAVGGPFPTSVPEDAQQAGADYLVLDEGELTIPPFLALLAREGLPPPRSPPRPPRVFRSGGLRPALTQTPIPRFDLLDLRCYDTMAVQFSRGCPFRCEFCDITVLYGRRPRTKRPDQVLAELRALYDLGWRRGVFLVDDNFIGNKAAAKDLLGALHRWQQAHGYPFGFETEASIDLADDPGLLGLMRACRFHGVFIGIETPDVESLRFTRKDQNTRHPMAAALARITRHGMRVMAGFIIGFDGERAGAGRRILDFVEATNIPAPIISMLQALPNTDLWIRLGREGRLLQRIGTINQDQAINFVPTRPAKELVGEYLDALFALTDPLRYLDRCYRYFLDLEPPAQDPDAGRPADARTPGSRLAALGDILVITRAFAVICWRQGVRRATRRRFWHHLAGIARHNPGVLVHYVAVCAQNEHFLEHRELVRRSLQNQLPDLPPAPYHHPKPTPRT